MDNKALIAARLAEWNLQLTDQELDQLVAPYENLVRWQGVVEDMLRTRSMGKGMRMPESEPLLVHALEEKGGAK